MTIENNKELYTRLKKLKDELTQNKNTIDVKEYDRQMLALRKEWVKNVNISKSDIKIYIYLIFATCGFSPILQFYILYPYMKGLKIKEKFRYMIASASTIVF